MDKTELLTNMRQGYDDFIAYVRTLDPTQLVKFLAAFRAHYPQHHALVTLLTPVLV